MAKTLIRLWRRLQRKHHTIRYFSFSRNVQSAIHEGLLRFLTEAYGSIRSIEPLCGKSGASVYRLRFARTSRIVKHTSSSAEQLFYIHVAPILSSNGIPLPEVEVVLHNGWIALEDIPNPLPREMWHGDTQLVEILARLHSGTMI